MAIPPPSINNGCAHDISCRSDDQTYLFNIGGYCENTKCSFSDHTDDRSYSPRGKKRNSLSRGFRSPGSDLCDRPCPESRTSRRRQHQLRWWDHLLPRSLGRCDAQHRSNEGNELRWHQQQAVGVRPARKSEHRAARRASLVPYLSANAGRLQSLWDAEI